MAGKNSIHSQKFSEVRNGPKPPQSRNCTDVCCFIFFTLTMVTMVVLTIYGFRTGDINNIYRGVDQKGNVCGGSNSAASDFPFVYIYNPTIGNLLRRTFSLRTCVKSCPTLIGNSPTPINCYSAGNNQLTCAYDVEVNSTGHLNTTWSSNSFIGYETQELNARICMPTTPVLDNAFSNESSTFRQIMHQGMLPGVILGLQSNWSWVVLALTFSFAMSLSFVLLLRCCPSCFIVTSIMLTFAMLIGGAILFIRKPGFLAVADKQTIIGQVFAIGSVFIFFIIICGCGKIRLVITLCSVAGKFLSSTKTIMLVPFIMALGILVFWVFALSGIISIVSTADFTVKYSTSVFTNIGDPTSRPLIMLYIVVFGTLWGNAMLMSITAFVVATATSNWYFGNSSRMRASEQSVHSRSGFDLPVRSRSGVDSPICFGFWMALRYHFGTLALGSFILALVQFIQFIFEMTMQALEMLVEKKFESCCMRTCVQCSGCFLACFKWIVEFLNKSALIQTSITGRSFCESALNYIALITENPQRFETMIFVGQLLAIVGKVFIAGLTAFFFEVLITYKSSQDANIQGSFGLLFIVTMMSYAIATAFMSLFEVSVGTLLQCYLIDELTNEKPLYADSEMTTVLQTKPN